MFLGQYTKQHAVSMARLNLEAVLADRYVVAPTCIANHRFGMNGT